MENRIMAYGNAFRMWTLEEYIKEYDKLEAENAALREERDRLKQRNKDLVVENKLLRLSINTHQRKLEQSLQGANKDGTDSKRQTSD